MAHFAEIDENNIVVRVLVVTEEFINTGNLGNPSKWIQTSYNTHGGKHLLDPTESCKTKEYDKKDSTIKNQPNSPFRKNYAGIGYTYDSVRDAFIPPKPNYPSWILDEETCFWDAPVKYPKDRKDYEWDEEKQKWIEIKQ